MVEEVYCTLGKSTNTTHSTPLQVKVLHPEFDLSRPVKLHHYIVSLLLMH